MRFSTVAITLFGAAASASASTLFARQNTLPDCAIPCTMSADFGGCAPTDNHCLCTNQAFVSSTTTCVQKACTGTDLQNALAFSRDLCLKVGVTLTASPSSTPAGSSTPAASTGASSTGAASGASSTPTAPATTAGSTTAGASSPAAPQPTSGALSTSANAVLGLAAAALVALAL
ncbi:hypothetical protein D9619_010044 [Psilocybe cf. subviscida]|uniref:CFEM domain-containing protein n=1 Tax=Psilocybe cf. subviscida TaxID=2480587 RepID=A0A8H5BNM0_9AGAR|nr:hypothetical protein D9619_010044 [Psilocybe cf. subviscida]